MTVVDIHHNTRASQAILNPTALGRALRLKFDSPKDVFKRLGLDESILDFPSRDNVGLDSSLEEDDWSPEAREAAIKARREKAGRPSEGKAYDFASGEINML
jgi:hypothetical protein